MFNTKSIIGVIGSGAMGSGIAQVASTSGHNVLIFDSNKDALQKAKSNLENGLSKLVEKQKITEEKKNAIIANIKFCSALTELASCDLVIEAIVEKLEIKQQVFSELEKLVKKECVLASNTSSLSITSIASAVTRPHQV